MAALVTNGQGAANNNPVTGSLDTTGATLLVAVVTYTGTVTGVSDSKSNTWTALTAYSNSGIVSRIYYVNSSTPTVGSGHTFTLNGTGIAGAINVMAFSGSFATPFSVENGSNSTSASTIQPGSVTPTNDDNIIITGFTGGNTFGGAGSINQSFTITNQVALTGGVNYGSAAAYLIQGAASAVNPTWTLGSTVSNISSSIAVFKQTQTLTTNLKAYYKLDESSGNAADSSGNTRTLTNNGTTAFATGKINNAADFGSTNTTKNFNRTPDPLTYTDLGAAWTVNCWVNVSSLSSNNRICRYILNNGSLERNFTFDIDTSGHLIFSTFDGTSRTINGTTVLSTATWYMITVQYTGSQMQMFINNTAEGTPISFSWSGFSRTSFSNFSVGAEQLTNGGAGGEWFKGLVDEFGVWNQSLSGADLTTLYNGGAGLQYPFAAGATNTNFFSVF